MDKKNTLLLTVIAISALIIAIIGSAFAYFAASINTENVIGVNVNTAPDRAIFTATSSGDINIDVKSYMMQQHDADNSNTNTSSNTDIAPLLSNTANINVVLQTSKDDKITTCSYDVVFTWNETASGNNFKDGDGDNTLSEAQSQYGSKEDINPTKYYVRSSGGVEEGFKELTVAIDSYTYTSAEDRPTSHPELTETNIDSFKIDDSSNKITLLKGQTISSAKTDTTNHIIYEVTVKFYNLPIDQTKLMNKTFSGTIGVENVIC